MNENDNLITVCSRCHQASCWQGQFYCSESQTAGTVRLTVEQLTKLDTGEHPSYWKPDWKVAAGI